MQDAALLVGRQDVRGVCCGVRPAEVRGVLASRRQVDPVEACIERQPQIAPRRTQFPVEGCDRLPAEGIAPELSRTAAGAVSPVGGEAYPRSVGDLRVPQQGLSLEAVLQKQPAAGQEGLVAQVVARRKGHDRCREGVAAAAARLSKILDPHLAAVLPQREQARTVVAQQRIRARSRRCVDDRVAGQCGTQRIMQYGRVRRCRLFDQAPQLARRVEVGPLQQKLLPTAARPDGRQIVLQIQHPFDRPLSGEPHGFGQPVEIPHQILAVELLFAVKIARIGQQRDQLVVEIMGLAERVNQKPEGPVAAPEQLRKRVRRGLILVEPGQQQVDVQGLQRILQVEVADGCGELPVADAEQVAPWAVAHPEEKRNVAKEPRPQDGWNARGLRVGNPCVVACLLQVLREVLVPGQPPQQFGLRKTPAVGRKERKGKPDQLAVVVVRRDELVESRADQRLEIGGKYGRLLVRMKPLEKIRQQRKIDGTSVRRGYGLFHPAVLCVRKGAVRPPEALLHHAEGIGFGQRFERPDLDPPGLGIEARIVARGQDDAYVGT